MTVAAFLVSCVALLVAIASVCYSRIQANLARDRRRDELTPTFTVSHDAGVSGQEDGVLIRNEGPEEYDRVGFAIIPSAVDDLPIVGLLQGDALVSRGDLGSFSLGEERRMEVGQGRQGDGSGGTLRLMLTCHKGGMHWSVLADCTIPPTPWFSYG